MQFTKEYTLPSELEKQQRVEQAVIALERFVDAHRPNRIYKKPSNVKKLDIKQQVRHKEWINEELYLFDHRRDN